MSDKRPLCGRQKSSRPYPTPCDTVRCWCTRLIDIPTPTADETRETGLAERLVETHTLCMRLMYESYMSIPLIHCMRFIPARHRVKQAHSRRTACYRLPARPLHRSTCLLCPLCVAHLLTATRAWHSQVYSALPPASRPTRSRPASPSSHVYQL